MIYYDCEILRLYNLVSYNFPLKACNHILIHLKPLFHETCSFYLV